MSVALAQPRSRLNQFLRRRIVPSLILGAFITLALAWIDPLIQPFLPAPTTRAPNAPWTDIQLGNIGHGGVATAGLFSFCSLWGGKTPTTPEEWHSAGVPAWAALPAPSTRAGMSTAYSYGYGWPARCLVYINAKDTGANLVVNSSFRARTNTPLAMIPTTPYWPGLIIDWFLWSIVAAILLACITGVVRWRAHRGRLRHGLCIKCAYPLAGLPTCPECGTPSGTNVLISL